MDDLSNRFAYHPPTTEGIGSRHAMIRRTILDAAVVISDTTPSCREQSLAIRKLEEAMFWANTAIARNQ